MKVELVGGQPPGAASLESPAYRFTARPICLKLLRQAVRLALPLAALKAGSKSAARIAIVAMTTNNSIKVNPLVRWNVLVTQFGHGGMVHLTPSNDQAHR